MLLLRMLMMNQECPTRGRTWWWYIYYDEVSVCVSRKMITSSWESPVTTWTPHNHPVQLQVSFDGSRLVFHGSMSVFIGFQGLGWFQGGFQVGFMVFHGFGWFPWFFMVFGWFPWFFMVPDWFVMVPGWFFMVFLQNVPAPNCILARRSSLGPPPGGRHRT